MTNIWRYLVDGAIPFAPDTYDVAHSSTPNSVMNHNDEVRLAENEPDCAPYPLDILAIYALYQTPVQ